MRRFTVHPVGRVVRVLAVLLCTLAVLPASSAVASNSSTVTLGASLNTGGNASVAQITCATTTCAAVGSFTTSQGTTVPFVSINSTGSWVTSALSAVSGTGSSVQCETDQYCVAVGTRMVGGVTGAWADVWNGQFWHVTSVGADLGAQSIASVGALSCYNLAACAFGGTFVDASGLYQPYVSVLENGSWASSSVATTLNAGGDGAVQSVSCAGDGSCTAVGYVTSGLFLYQGFAAQLVNGQWSTEPVGADLTKVASTNVETVSCSSASSCLAGGTMTDTSGNQQAFVGSWNGTAWSDQTVGTMLNVGNNASVTSLSCAPDGSCAVVGNYLDGNNNEQAFAATLDNANWTVSPVAQSLQGQSSVAQSVTCLSVDQCIASGYVVEATGVDQAFTSIFDGVQWSDRTVFSDVNAGGYGDATTTACSSAACYAAGTFTDNQGDTQTGITTMPLANQSSLLITTPNVAPANTAPILAVTGGSGQSLVQYATQSTGCSIKNGALSVTTPGVCVVTATNPANGLYLATSVTSSINFTAVAQQALSIVGPSKGVAGTALLLTAYGGSGVRTPKFSTTTPGCSITNGNLNASRPVACSVTVANAANGIYSAVTGHSVITFVAAQQASLILRVSGAPVRTTSVRLSVSGGSGVRDVGISVLRGACTIQGDVVHGVGPTLCALQAHNAANGIYGLATSSTLYIAFGQK